MVNTGIAFLGGRLQNQCLSIVYERYKSTLKKILKNVRWFIEGTLILLIGFPLTLLICIAYPHSAPCAMVIYLKIMVDHDKKI